MKVAKVVKVACACARFINPLGDPSQSIFAQQSWNSSSRGRVTTFL